MRLVTRSSPCRPRRKRYGEPPTSHRKSWPPNRACTEETIMYAFDYHRPSSLADAARLIASCEDGKLLAGGHTLLPTMKLRLAGPKNIVDLGRITELRGIDKRGSDLVIGAMETHDAVANSPQVRATIPGLAGVAAHIGDQHVRHRGP